MIAAFFLLLVRIIKRVAAIPWSSARRKVGAHRSGAESPQDGTSVENVRYLCTDINGIRDSQIVMQEFNGEGKAFGPRCSNSQVTEWQCDFLCLFIC